MAIYFYGHSTRKPYKQFSNFFPSPLTYHDVPLKTGEHALHWRKAMLCQDYPTAKQILQCDSPDQAKKLGRKVKKFSKQQWDAFKYSYMVEILKIKFSDPVLKEILVGTGDQEIFEASSKDKIWGIGISVADAEAGKAHRGANLLGKALMEVRASLV